jgi:transposase-like protein
MSRKVSEVVKAEIQHLLGQGVSLSRISQVGGVDRTTLWKWLYGDSPRGLGAKNIDRLCEMFGLQLVSRQALRADLLSRCRAPQSEQDPSQV